MGKWIESFKQDFNEVLKLEGDKVDIVNIKTGLSTMSPSSLSISQKKEKLSRLIKKLSDYYGGDDESFLNKYIEEVLTHHDLDMALKCFQGLALEIQPVKNSKFTEGEFK
jgi:hypothetical protein